MPESSDLLSNPTGTRRLDKRLLLATGLVVVVATVLGSIVIPDVIKDTSPYASPAKAVPPISIFVVLHLLAGVVLLSSMFAHRRGHVNRRGLLWTGIVLVVFGLLLIDGALTYLDHPDLLRTSIVMFAGCAFDFIAGFLAFMVRRQAHQTIESPVNR